MFYDLRISNFENNSKTNKEIKLYALQVVMRLLWSRKFM